MCRNASAATGNAGLACEKPLRYTAALFLCGISCFGRAGTKVEHNAVSFLLHTLTSKQCILCWSCRGFTANARDHLCD